MDLPASTFDQARFLASWGLLAGAGLAPPAVFATLEASSESPRLRALARDLAERPPPPTASAAQLASTSHRSTLPSFVWKLLEGTPSSPAELEALLLAAASFHSSSAAGPAARARRPWRLLQWLHCELGFEGPSVLKLVARDQHELGTEKLAAAFEHAAERVSSGLSVAAALASSALELTRVERALLTATTEDTELSGTLSRLLSFQGFALKRAPSRERDSSSQVERLASSTEPVRKAFSDALNRAGELLGLTPDEAAAEDPAPPRVARAERRHRNPPRRGASPVIKVQPRGAAGEQRRVIERRPESAKTIGPDWLDTPPATEDAELRDASARRPASGLGATEPPRSPSERAPDDRPEEGAAAVLARLGAYLLVLEAQPTDLAIARSFRQDIEQARRRFVDPDHAETHRALDEIELAFGELTIRSKSDRAPS